MSVFMARGYKDKPFHRHVARSLAYYVTPRKRAQLRALVRDSEYSGDEADELLEVLDSDTLTVWGAKASGRDADIFHEMAAGDYFLMRTGQPEEVKYVQQLDLTLGDDVPLNLRQELSDQIWTGPEYEYIWFSETPMQRVSMSQEEFVDLIRESRPDMSISDSEWFPSQGMNFTQIDDELLADIGGEEVFIDRLLEYDGHALSGEIENCFLIDADASEIDVRAEQAFKFEQKSTSHIDDLLDAEYNARVLLATKTGIFAVGRLGNIEGSREDGSIYKRGTVVDWVDVEPIALNEIPDSARTLNSWTEGDSKIEQPEQPITVLPAEAYLSVVTEDPLAVDPVPGGKRVFPCEQTTKRSSFYWVNQSSRSDEQDQGYLRAATDEYSTHDLGRLEIGDVVFNYTSGKLRGYSEVQTEARPLTYLNDDDERVQGCQVQIEFQEFDRPLPLPQLLEELMSDEVKLRDYYPVGNAGINQGYLFNLSQEAGEYILSEAGLSEEQVQHPVIEHLHSQPTVPNVWRFSVGASDWLTILRRGALHLWDTKLDDGRFQTQWRDTEEGDIILFHVTREDRKVGGHTVDNFGIIGVGIVEDRRRKTDLWWINEEHGLEYPYLVNLSDIYVTSNLSGIDRDQPLFELNNDEIVEEFPSLVNDGLAWDRFAELYEGLFNRQPDPQNGAYRNLNASAEEADQLLHRLLRHIKPDLTHIEEWADLPGMLQPANSDWTGVPDLQQNLQETMQVALYGPPGTGKTYNAMNFARDWIHKRANRPNERRVRMVTFSPAYSYEDFIEGLSAKATDKGQVEYTHSNGTLKQIAEDAWEAYANASDPDNAPPYVLIIDEINRGDLPHIFGETITLLEKDKRGDTTVDLTHSGEEFALPPNLYVIGTMNTADRSIALVDAAIRRRFRFMDQSPSLEPLYDHFGIKEADAESVAGGDTSLDRQLQALSILALEKINKSILAARDLSKGKQLGHSYLMDDRPMDREELVDAWRYEIMPLLEEYFFGQFDRIENELFEGDADALLDAKTERIKNFDADDLKTTLSELVLPEGSEDIEASEHSSDETVGE